MRDRSKRHLLLDTIRIAEDLEVTPDFFRIADALIRIVREFYRGPAVRFADLADERNCRELLVRHRRAIVEIVGEIGAPTEAHPHPSTEMPIGFLDRVDIKRVGKDEKLVARIFPL